MKSTAAMDDLLKAPHHGKLSPAFSSRLASLKPGQKLHAIVVLRTPALAGRPSGTRPTREQRQATINDVRSSSAEALRDIDDVLRKFHGRRLSDQPTAMGTISVESTAAGISALADSEHVRAVMEDQPISPVL
jgi:hypothetical protein